MKQTKWKKTNFPHKEHVWYRIKFKDPSGKLHTRMAGWSKEENTYITEGSCDDAQGLYQEDGWKIIAWMDYKEADHDTK